MWLTATYPKLCSLNIWIDFYFSNKLVDHVLTRPCHRDPSDGCLTCESLHIYFPSTNTCKLRNGQWKRLVECWQSERGARGSKSLNSNPSSTLDGGIWRACRWHFCIQRVIPAALLLMDRAEAVPRQPEMRWVKLQLKQTVAWDLFNEHSPTTLRHAGAQRPIRPEREEGHQNEAGDVWLFN